MIMRLTGLQNKVNGILPGWPDELYDGGGEGHADQDVDGAQQHVRGFI